MGSSPQQPNPAQSMMMAQALGQQQAQANLDAAKQQQKLNMTPQQTMFGSLNYVADPNSPNGYKAVQSYTPELQNILTSNQKFSQGMSDTGNALLGNQGGALSQGVDLSYGANAQRIADLQRQTLDPIWQRRQNDFDQQMANRGVMPGSAAYDNSYRDFQTGKNDAYNSMFLNAYDKTNNAAVQQFNTNMGGLNAFQNGSQVQAPVSSLGLTSTPQASVAAPDIMGAYNSSMGQQQNAYNNQMANNSATMGGLFGLGGSIAGGLAGSFAGPMGASIGSRLGSMAGSGLASNVVGGAGNMAVPTFF